MVASFSCGNDHSKSSTELKTLLRTPQAPRAVFAGSSLCEAGLRSVDNHCCALDPPVSGQSLQAFAKIRPSATMDSTRDVTSLFAHRRRPATRCSGQVIYACFCVDIRIRYRTSVEHQPLESTPAESEPRRPPPLQPPRPSPSVLPRAKTVDDGHFPNLKPILSRAFNTNDFKRACSSARCSMRGWTISAM
jgi:hypothetical protein